MWIGPKLARRVPGRRAPRRLLAPVALLMSALSLAVCSGRQVPQGDLLDLRRYEATEPADAVAALQKRLDRGQAQLTYEERRGYLESALRLLHVPPSSQALVFSKTSFQAPRISPQAPRAVYFNDDVYIGWVQDGDVLEVSAVDPQLGAVFYVLPQRDEGPHRFVRVSKQCLECHYSAMTGGIVGHIMRSVHVLPDGQPDLAAGSFLTTDQSPLAERWGGWYVSGTASGQRHMGNQAAGKAPEADVTDLRRLLDVSPYLTGHSDIVALMALAHQTHVHNLIARANWSSRAALADERQLRAEIGGLSSAPLKSTMARIEAAVDPLVDGLLFVGEAPLAAPVAGTSTFAADFAARGPRDRRGRSLRELDLKRRLLRYPCSYLIYSRAFDGMPELARNAAYRRIWEILSGRTGVRSATNATPEERKAALEILIDTKPEFAAWISHGRIRRFADDGRDPHEHNRINVRTR